MKLFSVCRTFETVSAWLSTYKEMYGNMCRTLLSEHLSIKALFGVNSRKRFRMWISPSSNDEGYRLVVAKRWYLYDW